MFSYGKEILVLDHRKISLIEGIAKCRHLKKIYLYRDFAAGVYLSEAQNPIPPPLHTVYVYSIQYTVYLFTQGRGGRVEQERRLVGQQFTKLLENTNMTDCTSRL